MRDLILLVEDDEVLGDAFKDFFENNGLSVICATNGENAIRRFKESAPGLVLLDVVLPDKDGFEVAGEIRKTDDSVPIIFMTGTALNTENYNKAYRLLRAANYIEKPIIPERVLAQILSLLHPVDDDKRCHIHGRRIFVDGPYVLVDGKRFRLRDKEARVLSLLLARANTPVSRSDLLLAVWGTDEIAKSNLLDTAVSRIKKTLKNSREIDIQTIWGVGYILSFLSPQHQQGQEDENAGN